MSLTSCLTLMGWWSRPPRPFSGTCWRREGLSPRSGPMGWRCCGGSGSSGLIPGSPGIGRHVPRPGISAGGCRSLASSPDRTGARRLLTGALSRLVRAVRTRRRCVRIQRRCCGRFTTSTGTRAPGRSLTRSRCTGPGAAGGRMRITIRWSRTGTSAVAFTGRGCPAASRAVFLMRSSTRSSPGFRRTGTGHWSPSTCPLGRGRRSCCQPRWRGWIRDGS